MTDATSVLVCPSCHATLDWSLMTQPECAGCGATYEERDGVVSLLIGSPDQPWEQTESGLRKYLRAEPERERALLSGTPDQMNAADLFCRGLLVEEEGRFEEAERLIAEAVRRSYRREYLEASEAQLQCVSAIAAESRLPIVDVASGRGTLVRALVAQPSCGVVASDVSPLVLRRMRRRFAALGLRAPLRFVAFDAAAMPYPDSSLDTVTTYLGLPNLPQPDLAIRELRRVVSGRLLAVCYFIADDDPNLAMASSLGNVSMLIREQCLAAFAQQGWSVSVENEIVAPADPTPLGQIVDGAAIDTFPVVATEVTWCVLVAS